MVGLVAMEFITEAPYYIKAWEVINQLISEMEIDSGAPELAPNCTYVPPGPDTEDSIFPNG